MAERSDINKYSIFNRQFPDKAGFTLRYNRLVWVREYWSVGYSITPLFQYSNTPNRIYCFHLLRCIRPAS